MTRSSKPLSLKDRIADGKLSVLILSGEDDRIVLTRDSMKLAKMIPIAALKIFRECGHVQWEECPQEILVSAVSFVQSLNLTEEKWKKQLK